MEPGWTDIGAFIGFTKDGAERYRHPETGALYDVKDKVVCAVEPTEAQQLACTETASRPCSICDIIDTQNQSGICARCTNRPLEAYGFRLGHVMTNALDREFSVYVERASGHDIVDITARCKRCKTTLGYYCAGDSFRHYIKSDPEKLVGGLIRDFRCVCSVPLDPMERYVDGLTVRECLDRYEAQQQGEGRGRYIKTEEDPCAANNWHWHPCKPLTPAQKDAARSAWSAELRKRQEEAREKERCRVRVDIQEVE